MLAVVETPPPVAEGGLQESSPHWRVLWTRSHCEQLVHDQLVASGYQPFLPTVEVGSQRNRSPKRVPLFPGYLFLDDVLDKARYLDVVKARGLVRILGDRWDRLAAVSGEEMEAIRQVCVSGLPAWPHPYLREGRRARILEGALAGLEGVFVRSKPSKGLLVLSVELLQRSVAVEVACTAVAPV